MDGVRHFMVRVNLKIVSTHREPDIIPVTALDVGKSVRPSAG